MTGFEYVEYDDAVAVVARIGTSIKDAGLLESALYRPQTVVWGDEAYVGLHLKGAALMDAINRAHVLDDGNKRLSWYLSVVFYELNGWDLYSDDDAATDAFIRQVGGEHLPLDDIAKWLELHSRPMPDSQQQR